MLTCVVKGFYKITILFIGPSMALVNRSRPFEPLGLRMVA